MLKDIITKICKTETIEELNEIMNEFVEDSDDYGLSEEAICMAILSQKDKLRFDALEKRVTDLENKNVVVVQ